jgi:hypothetical protein
MHHDRMFFIGAGADEVTDDHEGYVAGRCRDGTRSDIWTDVSRCPRGAFTGYLPACECGWSGADRTATPAGYAACQRAWLDEHFAPAVAPQRRADLGPRFAATLTSTDFDWGRGLNHLLAGHARVVADSPRLLDSTATWRS